MALTPGPEDFRCSARECTEPAAWAVIWQNPKIHTNREKTWLACVGHRDFLVEYVRLRDFPVRTVAVEDLD